MADVFGVIGNEQVQLNNAATEATLKQLLAAVRTMGGATAASKVAGAAGAAGLNPTIVAAANSATQDTTKKLKLMDDAISPLIGKLLKGTAEASDVFGAIESKVGGPLGLFVSALRRVAQFQEDNLKVYQQISSSGVSFAGSLTDMRVAAASTYMTLTEFSNLVKTNSETFAKMGGTVDDGARAFVRLSKSLNASETGTQLRALGYTSEQVNQGLATYIAATGGRNKQELQNTAAITKGAAEYLTQLDALATISGKSREQQEQALKEAQANQAYQSYLLTLDEEGKKKANAAMLEANAKGGKGAVEALQSQFLGLPPMTKAAQQFTALAPAASNSLNKMAANVKDSTKSVADQQKEGARLGVAVSQDVARIGKDTSNAIIMGGDAIAGTMGQMVGTSNQLTAQGIKSNEDAENQLASVAAQQKARRESEAKAAAETQKAMQELGQTVLAALLPAIKLLTPVVNFLVQAIGFVATEFGKLNGYVQLVIGGIIAYLAIKKVTNAKAAATSAASTAAGGKGLLGMGLAPLGSPTNPMYVVVLDRAQVRRARARAGRGAAGRAGGGGAGGGGAGGGAGAGRVGGAGRLASAGSAALGVAKLAGPLGAVIAGGALLSNIKDINDQAKEGKITAEEAKKQEASAVGEAGGGFAGGLAGAAAGAAIGSVVPVLGTAIGGLIGGVVGAYGGGLLGKSAAENLVKPTKATDIAPTEAEAKPAADSTKAKAADEQSRKDSSHLETLNKQMADMVKYIKDTAENTRRTVDAAKSLGGNLW